MNDLLALTRHECEYGDRWCEIAALNEAEFRKVGAERDALIGALESLWYHYHDLLDHRPILDRCGDPNCVAARTALQRARGKEEFKR